MDSCFAVANPEYNYCCLSVGGTTAPAACCDMVEEFNTECELFKDVSTTGYY